MIVTADWVLPVCEPPIRNGAVAVREGVIVEVGPAADICARWMDDTDARELDGCILAPGLVNAHTHLALTALGGLLTPAPLAQWLRRVSRAVVGLTREEFGTSAALGAAHCLLSGTTVVGDIVYGAESLTAATALGLGGAFCWELLGMEAGEIDESLTRRGFPHDETGLPDDIARRVTVGLSPHTPYTAGPALLTATHALARRHGAPFVIHVAESASEVELLAEGTGPFADPARRFAHGFAVPHASPVAYLESLGVLADAVCVHAVHVDETDAVLLANAARAVVVCPRSNGFLDNGMPPIHTLRRSGVRLAVGTDSSASNEDLDLFAEVRAVRSLDPTIDAHAALEMVTVAGAQALGLAGSFGTLASGVQADLVAVRVEGGDDPVEAFLAAGAVGVENVMAGGEWVVWECAPAFPMREIEARAATVRKRAAGLMGGA